MTQAYRIDAVEIKSARIDEQGFMQVGGVIARVGVQEYMVDGTIVRELRPESEVIKSAKTFVRKPMTLNHPPVFVNADNATDYLKGMTSTIQYQDGLLIDTEMSITHQDAIEAGLSTHKQLSAGYLVDLKPESGVWVDIHGVQGEPGKSYEYDAVQTNIQGNHVALVEQARAGKIASLKLDSATSNVGYAVRNDESKIIIDNKLDDKKMSDIKNDQTEAWLARLDAAKEEAKTLSAKFDSLSAEYEQVKAEKAELSGKVDAYEAKVAELETKVAEANEARLTNDQIAAEVQSRVALWNLVTPHLDGVEVDYSKSELEIKKVFLSTKVDAAKVEAASEEMIAGMWTVLAPKSDTKPEVESKTEEQAQVIDSTENVEISDAGMSTAAKRRKEAEKALADQMKSRHFSVKSEK